MSGPLQPGACRSCGRHILWAETVTGNRTPLDCEPAPDGAVMIVDGKAVVLTAAMKAEKIEGPRYLSHFQTCPKAAAHRKPRASPAERPGLFGDAGEKNLPG